MSKWKFKKLGDISEVKSGGTPTKAIKEYWSGNISWYSSGELNSLWTKDSKEKITKKGLNESNAKLFPKGSLLIGMYDTAALKMSLLDREAAFNQAISGVKPNDYIDLKFVFYSINAQKLELLKSRRGVRQKNLNLSKIKNIAIPVPSLAEQRRIVGILDEAFEGIDRAEANTKKNLANAIELFDSYLNKVFTEKGDGWVDKNLEDIAIEFGRGKSKHRPRNDRKLYGGEYPFIQTGDIRNANHIVKKYSQTYNETGLAQSKLWKKGTVCITIAANIAETAILDFDACIPDSIIGIHVDETKAHNIFVEYMLQSFKLFLQAKGKGSAQDNINMGTFKNQTFPFPDVNSQKKIANNLDNLSEEVYKLESIYQRKLEALAELKQSILQKAFTGQLPPPL